MNPKCRIALLFLPALALVLAALPACADTAYSYVGNDYTSAPGGYYTTSTFMTGDFTVASPLGDSLSDVNIDSDLTSWEIDDGFIIWSASNASISTFDISTSSTGAIDGWNIAIVGSTPFTYGTIIAHVGSSSSSGDSVNIWYNYDYPTYPLYRASNSDPGVWSGPPAVTPEPPGSVDMILGALLLGALAIGRRGLSPRRLSASA